MQALQRKLGDTVGWIVDTLLLDEGDANDETGKKYVQKRKVEAVEVLAYVRDVLKGVVTEVEDDRLVGEEEAKRRRDKERKAKEAAEALSRKNSTPHPPQRAAAIPIEARPQGLGARRSQDYFMPHPSSSSPPAKTAPVAIPVSQTVRTAPLPSSVPASISVPPPMSPPVVKSPISNSSTFNAPWNYTRSAFSSSDSPIATLPRVPPRTSAVLPRAGPLPASFRIPTPSAPLSGSRPDTSATREQTPKQTPYDPLGAIP